MLFEDPEVNITSPQSIIEPHKDSDCDWGRFIDSRGELSCRRPDSRLRVVAFCSFDFGFGALQEMARMHQELEIELVGIVTDDICDPKARISWKKRTWRFYPAEERVKLFQRTQDVAGELNIPFFSGSVKSTFFLTQLQAWNPDVILMYGFGQIIPEKVFRYPQLGMYNIHPSDIANKLYLGADPFGDMEKDEAISTVLTLHEVTKDVDGGAIRACTKPIFFGQKVSTKWGDLKNEMAAIVPDGNKMVRRFLTGLREE